MAALQPAPSASPVTTGASGKGGPATAGAPDQPAGMADLLNAASLYEHLYYQYPSSVSLDTILRLIEVYRKTGQLDKARALTESLPSPSEVAQSASDEHTESPSAVAGAVPHHHHHHHQHAAVGISNHHPLERAGSGSAGSATAVSGDIPPLEHTDPGRVADVALKELYVPFFVDIKSPNLISPDKAAVPAAAASSGAAFSVSAVPFATGTNSGSIAAPSIPAPASAASRPSGAGVEASLVDLSLQLPISLRTSDAVRIFAAQAIVLADSDVVEFVRRFVPDIVQVLPCVLR